MPDDVNDLKRRVDSLTQQTIVQQNQIQQLLTQARAGQAQGRQAPMARPIAPSNVNPATADAMARLWQQNPTAAAEALRQQVIHDATQAAATATNRVAESREAVKRRMDRLVNEYPDIRNDQSDLTREARVAYQEVKTANPGLDESTVYELSVAQAAARLGMKPASRQRTADEFSDGWTAGGDNGNTVRVKPLKGRNRITQNVMDATEMLLQSSPDLLKRFKNRDPKIMAELNDYSGRFGADRDESGLKYR